MKGRSEAFRVHCASSVGYGVGVKVTASLNCGRNRKKNDTLSTSRCATCKMQKKKCREECVLAPYFPQEQLDKFLLVRRVFGKANVMKMLRDLPAEQRGDAASSIVYEAQERVRDPVHGCLGVINHLQQKVAELQSELASTEARLADMSAQHEFYNAALHILDDDVDSLQLWEPLWNGSPLLH